LLVLFVVTFHTDFHTQPQWLLCRL
jgi:hypothetical protein